ncbi:Long chronological lifespan protein 2 [Monascus purpureus]|nr:Long chronological lifespan protein 2 [Monascus purpureus]
MALNFIKALWALLLLATFAQAQFQFFEHMFGGGQHQEHQHQGAKDASSDSSWYQKQWKEARCNRYLCPDTLACVHFPHHCPCPHPDVEEKIELGEGSAICVSRGGYKAREASRKIELARKGLL